MGRGRKRHSKKPSKWRGIPDGEPNQPFKPECTNSNDEVQVTKIELGVDVLNLDEFQCQSRDCSASTFYDCPETCFESEMFQQPPDFSEILEDPIWEDVRSIMKTNYIPINLRAEVAISESNLKAYYELQSLFDDSEFNTICGSCQSVFHEERYPYAIDCGHSFCSNCIFSSGEIFCSVCNKHVKVNGASNLIPNRDLMASSVSILRAMHEMSVNQARAHDTKCISEDVHQYLSNEMFSSSLSNLIFLHHISLTKIRTLDDEFLSRIMTCKKVLTDLSKQEESLARIRSLLEQTDIADLVNIKLSSLAFFSQLYKDDLGPMDDGIIEVLGDTFLNLDLNIGFRTSELTFGRKVISYLAAKLNGYACYATPQGELYSRLSIMNSHLCLYALKHHLDLTNNSNILMVDLAIMMRREAIYGVFFNIRLRTSKQKTQMFLSIEEKGLFAKQLYTLCTGEKGFCFKGGKGKITFNRVYIDSYLSNGNYSSQDILMCVPDELGSPRDCKMGAVCASRKYGHEVELSIVRYEEKGLINYVGKCANTELDKLPEDEFTIEECGIIFKRAAEIALE